MEAIVVLVDDRQRFVQRCERLVEATGLGIRLSQHAEIVGDAEFGASATKLLQPISKERQRLVSAAMKSNPAPL